MHGEKNIKSQVQIFCEPQSNSKNSKEYRNLKAVDFDVNTKSDF